MPFTQNGKWDVEKTNGRYLRGFIDDINYI